MKYTILQFNPFGENTYIVWDPATREAAVIDPGMMTDSENSAFDRFIADNDLKLKYLINTHLHIDHVAGDRHVEEHYGLKVSASTLDNILASRIDEQAQMFHLPYRFNRGISIAHDLKAGDTLMLGEEPLKVLAVPGHSQGSIALYAPQSELLFAGDAIFQGSVGRTDLPGGDYATLISSLKKEVMTLPADTVILPGHGPSTTVAHESVYNPFL